MRQMFAVLLNEEQCRMLNISDAAKRILLQLNIKFGSIFSGGNIQIEMRMLLTGDGLYSSK